MAPATIRASQSRTVQFNAREMKRLGPSLDEGFPTGRVTGEGGTLWRLVVECRRRSDDMLVLLSLLKNENPGSKLDTLSAALRNLRMKHERDRREKRSR
ncbi:hypothetical protein F5Y11DRAFT_226254 [Daldinia sp. FL1419]|nr:hypothetical protein F5Y11DRAFT_226254 [Daldinia sp. FL1419]